jgi:hypothetical protein
MAVGNRRHYEAQAATVLSHRGARFAATSSDRQVNWAEVRQASVEAANSQEEV